MSDKNNTLNELKGLAEKLNVSLRELFLLRHLNEAQGLRGCIDHLFGLNVPIEELRDIFGDDAVRAYFDNLVGAPYREMFISLCARGEFHEDFVHYYPALKDLFSVTDEEIEAARQRLREEAEKPKKQKRSVFGLFWGC